MQTHRQKKHRGKPLLLFPHHNRWRAALRTQTVPNLDDPPSPAWSIVGNMVQSQYTTKIVWNAPTHWWTPESFENGEFGRFKHFFAIQNPARLTTTNDGRVDKEKGFGIQVKRAWTEAGEEGRKATKDEKRELWGRFCCCMASCQNTELCTFPLNGAHFEKENGCFLRNRITSKINVHCVVSYPVQKKSNTAYDCCDRSWHRPWYICVRTFGNFQSPSE